MFPYHQRVFYCKDVRLYKPYFRPEDFQVYVSYALLYALGFTLPPLVVSFLFLFETGFQKYGILFKLILFVISWPLSVTS